MFLMQLKYDKKNILEKKKIKKIENLIFHDN